jgi:O-antigen ligase
MVSQRKRFIWSLVLVMVLLLSGFLVSQQSNAERMSFLLGRYSPYAGLSGRARIWQTALSAIAEDPLLGRGTGAAEWVVSSSFHNAYLEVWFNAGFVGLVLFVTSQVCFFYRILSLNRTLTDPEAKSILALALGYMLGFVVLCVFESIGAGASNLNLVLYILLGFLVSGDVLSTRASEPVEPCPMDSECETAIVPV